ncbi:MAG: type IV pilus modification protein PilV [Betaproteobacteria bacterium]|nr:type IV pilus modification protein PilV [Betaproteobacteria bacterium]
MGTNTDRTAPQSRRTSRQAGFTMIEVLITLIVLALGLIGVIGLQARGQQAELESYQRGQALALLQDMVDRINTDRAAAHSLSYVTSSPVGGGGALATCTTGTTPAAMAAYDLCDWGNELNGAAESTSGTTCTTSSGTGCIGAMLGARGCVSYDNTTELTDTTGAAETGTGIYTVTVAWQGLAPTAAPPANLTCGQNLYPAGSTANDAYRRVVMATLRIGDLNSP